jgi:hypothetical protein
MAAAMARRKVDLEMMSDQWLAEELSADIGPTGRDGIVNFSDWAVFANAWQSSYFSRPSPNWDRKCDLAPKGGDGYVNTDDLAVFLARWLETGSFYLSADVFGQQADGIVNLDDFAALAREFTADMQYPCSVQTSQESDRSGL